MTRPGAEGPDDPDTRTDASAPEAETGGRRETGLFAAAVVVAVLPVVVAAVRAVRDHWQPISDNGVTVVRTLDVFSSYFPFLGYGSSVSNVLPRIVNHPGPLQFILLAPGARLFGPSAGLALGTATMNAAAIVIVGWAARRRAGTTGGLLAVLVGGLLAWSMGSALLVDPWGPHSLILPLYAGCVLAWGVADGDLGLLPLAVGCASFASQTHLSVVYLGPGLLAVAATWGWIRIGRAGNRWIVISVLVAVLLWLPPLIEQFSTPVGNMTRLVEEAQHPPGGLIGPRNSLRVTAAVVGQPPFWLRNSMRTTLRPPGGSLSSTAKNVDALSVSSFGVALVELAVVGALLAVVLLAARRRRDRTVVTLALMAGVALVFAWYTIAQITTLVVGVSSHTFRILWSVAAFLTFALLLGAVRMLRAARGARRGPGGGGRDPRRESREPAGGGVVRWRTGQRLGDAGGALDRPATGRAAGRCTDPRRLARDRVRRSVQLRLHRRAAAPGHPVRGRRPVPDPPVRPRPPLRRSQCPIEGLLQARPAGTPRPDRAVPARGLPRRSRTRRSRRTGGSRPVRRMR